ncbi:hypothetical protein ZIOFF_029345 [Zingiber officinale]|uniref:Hexosyltransferase n=1 Tax=Zingiber officinale TaxID=94328 RepID=A0A8J5LAI9_ZINOF|nr:hypothetical protein ZIOFF_029345 [Zingiber officinale]
MPPSLRPLHGTHRLRGSAGKPAGNSLRSEPRKMMSVSGLDFLFNVSAAGSGPFSGLHKAYVLEDATGLLDPQKNLEVSTEWQAPPFPDGPVELFIGILYADFVDLQNLGQTSWKKEAEFFGDIVIMSFLDRYDLVVLKTVAIREYGVCIDYILSYSGFVAPHPR